MFVQNTNLTKLSFKSSLFGQIKLWVFFFIKTCPGLKKKKKTIWAATKFRKSRKASMGTIDGHTNTTFIGVRPSPKKKKEGIVRD